MCSTPTPIPRATFSLVSPSTSTGLVNSSKGLLRVAAELAFWPNVSGLEDG
ncbi:hypothetical protein DPMN_011988 [Dreissena polymorpha]|uniref:Uncharacterized protein n=1 Tax=Dreissena polymorpha TaxID=45954 RepID=A0A9D4N516_DREPO|nr:hypothetical protein DPMN_011988 [Dreissena polymorpha]